MPNFFNIISSFIIFFYFTHNHIYRIFIEAHKVFIYSTCSEDKYEPNSIYETNLNSLISNIARSSYRTLFNAYALGNDSVSSPPEDAIFGLYQCRGDLNTRDCATCIGSLLNQIKVVCPYTYGASIQLDRCFVRYEHTDFLGQLDPSLRYKRCSTSNGTTTRTGDFLSRREDVLADLQYALSSGFKVSSSSKGGLVQGYAQCVGDLNGQDCATCLSDAVDQVKALCGSSAAGDVFLAQCYVRYWEAGYYVHGPSDSYNGDQVGRTVAIILGVVASAHCIAHILQTEPSLVEIGVKNTQWILMVQNKTYMVVCGEART